MNVAPEAASTTSSGFGGVGTDAAVASPDFSTMQNAQLEGRQFMDLASQNSKLGMMAAQSGGAGSGDRTPARKKKRYSANPGEEYTEYEYDPDGQDYLTDSSEGRFYRPVTRRFQAGGFVDPMGGSYGYGRFGLLGLDEPMYKSTKEEIEEAAAEAKAKEAARVAALPQPQPELTPMPQPMPMPGGVRTSGGIGVMSIGGPGLSTIQKPKQRTMQDVLAQMPAAPKTQFTTIDQSDARAQELAPRYGQDFSRIKELQAERRSRLDKRRSEDKNDALLRTGLAIMGGESSNAFANISKGALSGMDYYAAAQEAQRREEEALAQGDISLASAQHADKLALLQMAMSEGARRDSAANADAERDYGRGIAAFGITEGDRKEAGEVDRLNVGITNSGKLAQYETRARAALASFGASQRGSGAGDELMVDRAMAKEVFGKALERDAARMQELAVKEGKGKLSQPEMKELQELRSPDRINFLVNKSYQAVGAPGGTYYKRSGQGYDGGLGGMGVVDATTKR